MKSYDRNSDTKRVESQANSNYGSARSDYKSKGQGYYKRNSQEREVTAPGYLTSAEKTTWLLNSFTGQCVKRREYDSNDAMLRRFKRVVESAGIMRELKKREFYLSPSAKRRDKKKRAQKRLRKSLKAEGEDQEKEDRYRDRFSTQEE